MKQNLAVVVIDWQNDFAHPAGSLFVEGADKDTIRATEWLKYHAHQIHRVVASLDSHGLDHIFLGTWFVNAEGEHPKAFTQITHQQFVDGVWTTTRPEDWEWTEYYLRILETEGKKTHTIWPPHCIVGTWGHQVHPRMLEALRYVTRVNDRITKSVTKGTLPKTEHYSMLEAEVKIDGEPKSQLNTELLDSLMSFKKIYVMGQAETHCVLETLKSFVGYYRKVSPATIKKIVILTDCMSPIREPKAMAALEEAYAEFRKLGIQFATSSDYVS